MVLIKCLTLLLAIDTLPLNHLKTYYIMNKSVFTRHLLSFMLLLLCSLTAQAADNLITEQVVVNVKSAGTLSSLIKKADRTRITNLKVTGKVNSQDLEWLRRMACCHDSQNNKETGNLQHLDLLDAKIIGGGDVVVYVPRHNAPSKLKAELKDDTFCSYLFTESKTLKSIILPKTLKSIESSVFSCCDSLTSVVLPEGLTHMEGGVFAGCTSLTSVTLPSTLKKIDGTSTFMNCTSLTSVSLPEDMVYFYGYTFEGCTSLKSITLPKKLDCILEYTFAGCVSLTSLYIPASVSEIGRDAFDGCSGITSFHVDEANQNYSSEGTVLFNKDKTRLIYALGQIEGDYKVPATVRDINEWAFRDQSRVLSVSLPEGLTQVQMYLFDGCTSLQSVSLPKSLKSIEYAAFKGCSSLASLSIPAATENIAEGAFEGCTGVTSFHVDEANPNYSSEGTVLFNKNKNKIIYALGHIEDYKVPASVDTIGASSFQDQSDLIYLTLPEGLKIIKEAAFTNSDKLKYVYAYMPEPATLENFSFATTVTGDFIYLYVPQGCSGNYFCDPSWSRFYIQEFDVTGTDVKSAVAGDDAKEVARYTVNGQRIKSPTKGINIVKYDDGTVKRVVVK